MRTLSAAPRTAARAARAPTPASVTEAGFPSEAMARNSGNASAAARAVFRGTWLAYSVAASMAAARCSFSLSVPLGRLMAALMRLKAAVSSSTSDSRRCISACPESAASENSFQRSSQPDLCADRLATIVPSAAPRAPI